MKYYIDLDNTICNTTDSDYINSTPIYDRINKVNELKRAGNHITIWTGRGARSGIDYRELTKVQLDSWGVLYDVLIVGNKPKFDVLIDDKAFNPDQIWGEQKNTSYNFKSLDANTVAGCATVDNIETPSPIKSPRKCCLPPPPELKRVLPYNKGVQIVKKTWGEEFIIANNEFYCGKILHFNKGYWGSMHFHMKKTETWFLQTGKIRVYWTDPRTGEMYNEVMNEGDVITHSPGQTHQVEAIKDSYIYEVSTPHDDNDTYRLGEP